MNNKPLTPEPCQAANDELELTLNTDELEQLAKFLDALLEFDIANRSDEATS